MSRLGDRLPTKTAVTRLSITNSALLASAARVMQGGKHVPPFNWGQLAS